MGEKEMTRIMTREDVVTMVKEQDVEFIRLQFTDMFGQLKNIAVTSSQLERALDNRFSVDGRAIDGFPDLGDTDMYLYPDYNTFEVFPWRPQQGRVARLLCDVRYENGKPFEGDSRYILKGALKNAAQMGYSLMVGPKCEFFLFHTDENGLPTTITHEQAGYLDISPLDLGENARRDMVLNLEQMGFIIEASHHEQAPAQHEIDFRYDEALTTADNIMTFRLAVKTIAKRHGLHATFMPKPKYGVNGSGMHLKMTLYKDGRNVFEDEKGEGLSNTALYFIGGILKHAKGITALTNPIVNSYKRLLPGFGAPVEIDWGTNTTQTVLRVATVKGKDHRIELLSPDSAANPYLALAVCIEAGLEGIRQEIMPVQVEKDLLPRTLSEALDAMEKDELVKNVLGEELFRRYLDAKRTEWDESIRQITEWELERYLYKY